MNYENDLRILQALYTGNHLNSKELERAYKLLKLLKIALKERIE